MRTLALGLLGMVVVFGPQDATVAIRTFRFRPAALEVSLGTRVTWSNGDDIEHTVTAGIPDSTTGVFDGVMKTQGTTFAFTFNRAGTFPYFCERHPFMRGEIRVTSTGEP